MKTVEELQQILDSTVNVLLGQHRGRVDATRLETISQKTDNPNSIDARVLYVKMSGGCQGCAGAKATLRSIVSQCVKEFDTSIVSIVDETDHTNKTNAFFKE